MSPIAVIALLPVTLFMEPDVISVTLTLAKQHQYMWILLLVNSVMAYSANLLNFLVTKHTSALTLQVKPISVSLSLYLLLSPESSILEITGLTMLIVNSPLCRFLEMLKEQLQW